MPTLPTYGRTQLSEAFSRPWSTPSKRDGILGGYNN